MQAELDQLKLLNEALIRESQQLGDENKELQRGLNLLSSRRGAE